MMNYAGCCKCQSRDFLGEEGRVRSVTGGEEEGVEGDSGNEGDGEEEEETISFKRNSTQPKTLHHFSILLSQSGETEYNICTWNSSKII